MGEANRPYKDKIKNREELKELIGPRPREHKVIMCHGTFDIVHPGHVRHLSYASEKSDILIASLTCDVHIDKANFRPFVPEELRAVNLAALEMVDYVVVDSNPTPLENLKFLEPDYFAKGYEYFDGGVHPSTAKEIEALESYGGEILFTPGDVVYSSSRLIDIELPDLGAEKLQVLMETEKVDMESLRKTLADYTDVKVHVVGDTIVDSYVYCTLIGGSNKTPTLSVKHNEQVDYAGGAAVVAKHLRQAGAQVKFSSVMGDDTLKDYVIGDLEACGIECYISVDPTRPTTQKQVFIANDYRMLKVDKLDNRPVAEKTLGELRDTIAGSEAEAFVFSDFRHGIFAPQSISQLTESIPAGRFKVADSQVASRWGNILDFQGFDLITPNEREARFALGDQDSVVRPLALKLYQQAQCRYLIMKLGERGILTYRSDGIGRPHFNIDSFAERVVDSVGTGDALLAYSTLALVASGSEVIASILGSMAAAIACENEGNRPVDTQDVLKKIDTMERLINYV